MSTLLILILLFVAVGFGIAGVISASKLRYVLWLISVGLLAFVLVSGVNSVANQENCSSIEAVLIMIRRLFEAVGIYVALFATISFTSKVMDYFKSSNTIVGILLFFLFMTSLFFFGYGFAEDDFIKERQAIIEEYEEKIEILNQTMGEEIDNSYSAGHEDGYYNGYEEGYGEGYDRGYTDGEDGSQYNKEILY